MVKIELGISVEGESEAYFVKFVLAEYLARYNINLADPIILGGNVSVSRATNILALMADNYNYVTTLYDFYGFVGCLESDSCQDIENKIKSQLTVLGKNNVIPYLQKYEFEALLFSDLQILCKHIYYNTNTRENCYLRLKSDMKNLSPEDIHGQKNGVPSKKLRQIFPHYKKSVHGYVIAQEIGIDKIRACCPRFNSWIATLIQLQPGATSGFCK